jgi:hypothetical protein
MMNFKAGNRSIKCPKGKSVQSKDRIQAKKTNS